MTLRQPYFLLFLAFLLTLPALAKDPLVIKILPRPAIFSGGGDGWNRLPVLYNSACTKNGFITEIEFTKNRIECELGKAAACGLVAKFFQQKKDLVSAEKFAKISCDKGDAYGCVVLGIVHIEHENIDAAESVLSPWCERGEQQACVNLGVGYLKANRPAQANLLFQLGCQKNNGVACSNLGVMSQQRQESAAALTLYKRGCGLGSCSACHNLAESIHDQRFKEFEARRQARESL